MMNQVDRERRIAIFEDTIQICERDEGLVWAIENTRRNTVVSKNQMSQSMDMVDRRFEASCDIKVSGNGLLQTAKELQNRYGEYRIGIVNFASAMNPGGSVIRGGDTIEESLCRCSTLYPCLNTEYLCREYYDRNRLEQQECDESVCIYTPDIVCLREDGKKNAMLMEKERFLVDVISCAAPERVIERMRDSASGCMNYALENEKKRLLMEWEDCIRGFLQMAVTQNVDVLVIGEVKDYAGEDFQERIVELFESVFEEYKYMFRAVYFANRNYEGYRGTEQLR